jgi:hypothetical protein
VAEESASGAGITRPVRLPALDRSIFWLPLGWRAEVVAAVLLGSLAIAVGGNAFLSQALSPASVLRAYLGAQSRGDADTMWSLMVPAPPSIPVDVRLISRSNLKAMLAEPSDRVALTDLSTAVAEGSESGNEISVGASYRTSAGLQCSTYRLRRQGATGPYETWLVVVPASTLRVTLPAAAGDLSVDDQPLAITRAVPQSIAVFPGLHRIALSPSAFLQGDRQTVEAAANAGSVTVTLNQKLTPAAETSARAELSKLFTACAGASELAPAGCPQSHTQVANAQDVKWQLLGDPAGAATFDASSQPLAATGHFQMLLSYFDGAVNGTQHVAVGGGFRADFQLTSDGPRTTAIVKAASVPPLVRPAEITDEAIKDVVRQAFATCAAATSLGPPDCPKYTDTQSPYGSRFVNVTWSLTGDPLAQAHVTFEGGSGLFNVTGPFSMQVRYERVAVSNYHLQGSVDGTFLASVIWNQGKPVMGGIDRTS